MPIEYEMMYLKNTVEDAIRQFSQNTWCADWMDGAETSVLDMLENDPQFLSKFQDYQIAAMRELVSRGYWLKWDDTIAKTVLSRINR